jgi:uncharacterized protein
MVPQSAGRLIQSLADPAVLGVEAAEEVQTLQTHMSWILLAGPHAYKIKKPLDLGFADFSTLGKRRHFCEEELRVNRRLAPGIYLEVVPVCGTPEAPTLGDRGEPIEYAVKMQRFPQEALLDRVLRRGELKDAHIDELVRQVADFHQRVEVDADGRGFGTPEAVRKPVDENFEQFSDEQDPQITALLERLRDWSKEQSRARQQDFAARKRDGFVRECHGDLHLGNIVLWDDAVVIFDAIEFNENLRWIDVLNELAFLVMDLEDRGRPDFARRALNRYLEITGDYRGLGVLPYYLTYRALVRAKVCDIRRRQRGVGGQEQRRLTEELGRYVLLADIYAGASTPKLIITHGVSGSGKTTATDQLVEMVGAVRIRSDLERKRLFGLDPLARPESDVNPRIYAPEATCQVYARLAELAEAVVRGGFTVIVDATFLERSHREMLARTAVRMNAPFHILDFHAEEQTLRQRVCSRRRTQEDASDADLAVLRQQLRSRQPLSGSEMAAAIRIDTSGPLANQFVRVVQAVRTSQRDRPAW